MGSLPLSYSFTFETRRSALAVGGFLISTAFVSCTMRRWYFRSGQRSQWTANRGSIERMRSGLTTKGCTMKNRNQPPMNRGERLCPVCGKVSYSKDGIHPQCAIVQADEPRQQQLAAERKRKEAKAKPSRTWRDILEKEMSKMQS